MPTPHLEAEPDAYSKQVLMPGDPLRAKHIAETFLSDVRQVNGVRNMLGYTGVFDGMQVSVQASGMGIPSMLIYATELFDHYGVEQVIRIGSCGALQETLELGDVVVASAAGTDSAIFSPQSERQPAVTLPSSDLLDTAKEQAKSADTEIYVGKVFTSDFFYDPSGKDKIDLLAEQDFLAIEMETAGLYFAAENFGAKALTLATVSDQIITGEKMTSKERETSLNKMTSLALATFAEAG